MRTDYEIVSDYKKTEDQSYILEMYQKYKAGISHKAFIYSWTIGDAAYDYDDFQSEFYFVMFSAMNYVKLNRIDLNFKIFTIFDYFCSNVKTKLLGQTIRKNKAMERLLIAANLIDYDYNNLYEEKEEIHLDELTEKQKRIYDLKEEKLTNRAIAKEFECTDANIGWHWQKIKRILIGNRINSGLYN